MEGKSECGWLRYVESGRGYDVGGRRGLCDGGDSDGIVPK